MATCKVCESIYSLENHKVCPNCKSDNAVLPLNAFERNKLMKTEVVAEAKTTNKIESAIISNGELPLLFGYGQ